MGLQFQQRGRPFENDSLIYTEPETPKHARRGASIQ
uniref:Uncharacterized protein n=1 Tax=Anguilla anguilla TaxID=7936 RepID=A0A0E9UYD2_ANGAN